VDLTDEERILYNFGIKIKDTETDVFDSKYISIYNELIKYYKISQAMKAGSLEKGTKIEFFGDLDLTFTIDNPSIKDETDFRKDLEQKMKDSFPNDNVGLLKKSVLIKFKKSQINIDVVYLPKIEYNKNIKQIRHIKSINEEIKSIIRIVKYWNYLKNKKSFKSYLIERSAIYSGASTYKKRVRDTISKSGGGKQVNEIYDVILKIANGVVK